MKHSLIIMVAFCISLHMTEAQTMSKAETKKWKKELKKYKSNPAKLKVLVENQESFDSQLQSVQNELTTTQQENVSKVVEYEKLTAEKEKLEQSNKALSSEVESLKSQIAKTSTEIQQTGFVLPKTGVVFRVQVGAYGDLDLTPFIDNTDPRIRDEKDKSGIQQITVGQFVDYYKADAFKKHLRAMGVKDAWIVPYENGQRTELKNVLDGIKN